MKIFEYSGFAWLSIFFDVARGILGFRGLDLNSSSSIIGNYLILNKLEVETTPRLL